MSGSPIHSRVRTHHAWPQQIFSTASPCLARRGFYGTRLLHSAPVPLLNARCAPKSHFQAFHLAAGSRLVVTFTAPRLHRPHAWRGALRQPALGAIIFLLDGTKSPQGTVGRNPHGRAHLRASVREITQENTQGNN